MTHVHLNRRVLLGAGAALLASPAILRAQTTPRDLATSLAGDADLARFAAIAARTPLGDRLKGSQALTVFAPSMAAWNAVPTPLLQDLGAGQGNASTSVDPVRLAALVGIHIIEGTHTAASLKDRVQDVRTLNGGLVRIDGRAMPPTIAVTAPEGGPRGNNQTGVGGFNVQAPAKVIRADIMASNGMIHVIDGVLLP